MKSKLAVCGLMVYCAATVAVGQPGCPTVKTTGPSMDAKPGEIVTFLLNITGGDPQIAYTYNWTVSAGTITSGQGTPVIKVDAQNAESVTASADVGGASRDCSMFSSYTISVAPGPRRPVSAEDFFNQGRSQMNDGKHRDAILSFSECIRQAPTVMACWALRGLSNKAIVKRDEAIADLTKALELDPTKTMFYEERGDVYFQKDMFKQAAADYSKLIKPGSTTPRLLEYRGMAYANLKDWTLAIADYTSCISLEPKNSGCYAERGIAKLGLQRRDAAIADFRKALEIQPGHWLAKTQLEKLGIK